MEARHAPELVNSALLRRRFSRFFDWPLRAKGAIRVIDDGAGVFVTRIVDRRLVRLGWRLFRVVGGVQGNIDVHGWLPLHEARRSRCGQCHVERGERVGVQRIRQAEMARLLAPVALGAAAGHAVLSASRAGAQRAAAAPAVVGDVAGGAQHSAACAAMLGAAIALAAADRSVVTEKQRAIAARDTALAARAGGVGGIAEYWQRQQEHQQSDQANAHARGSSLEAPGERTNFRH